MEKYGTRYSGDLKGSTHLVTSFNAYVVGIFQEMGFSIVTGPEAETVAYNFDALNIPSDHPARDAFDTFYIDPPVANATIMRTHTSPMQVRFALEHGAPCRAIVPGRVYRNESIDATHEAQFHQIEGLVIEKDTSLSDLIAVLHQALKKIFKKDIDIRVRPGFFPFVEPGIEIDVSCVYCNKKGCAVCKNTSWLEVLGAGMVHPKVLRNMNISGKEYRGYAFGIGVERILMLQKNIPDIRYFTGSDLRFSTQ